MSSLPSLYGDGIEERDTDVSSGSRDGGKFSGHLVMGVVMDNKSPWQDGSVKVNWKVGSAVQDQLATSDIPWSRTMFSTDNPSLNQVGGFHTGLMIGSKVYGFPIDGAGQDFLVLGSIVNSGNGQPDETQTPDSDVPTGVKIQTEDSLTQPRWGDKNNVAKTPEGGVVTDSIIQYAHDIGGPDRRPVKYGDPTDSVGNLEAIGGDDVGGTAPTLNIDKPSPTPITTPASAPLTS